MHVYIGDVAGISPTLSVAGTGSAGRTKPSAPSSPFRSTMTCRWSRDYPAGARALLLPRRPPTRHWRRSRCHGKSRMSASEGGNPRAQHVCDSHQRGNLSRQVRLGGLLVRWMLHFKSLRYSRFEHDTERGSVCGMCHHVPSAETCVPRCSDEAS